MLNDEIGIFNQMSKLLTLPNKTPCGNGLVVRDPPWLITNFDLLDVFKITGCIATTAKGTIVPLDVYPAL